MTSAPVPSRRALLLASAGALAVPRVRAQAGRPLRLIVPFTPGGSTDILARAIGQELTKAWGHSVIVDNVPGAGGAIGADKVAKAPGDGYTLLMGHIGTLAVNPALYPKLAYDPLKSFAPVAGVARVPNVLVVSAASPARHLAQWLALARAQPGRLSYSSGGNGSAAHIAMESLKLAAGLFLLHIPYRGTAPSVADLIAGQVDATFTGAPAVLPHVRSGRLRALAVSSAQRLASLPDVPTVAELGDRGEPGLRGFEADQWYGLVAPAGTPAPWLARLNAETNRLLASADLAASLAAEGALPMPGPAEAFGALIARELPRWRAVVRAARMQPD